MAKKSGKKIQPNIFISFWRKYTTLIILCVLGFVALGYWVVSYQIPKIQEKRDLENAYSQLERIANEITEVRIPNEKTSEKSCNYSSTKLGKGDLSCEVIIDLLFSNLSVENVNTLKSDISNKLGISTKEISREPDSLLNGQFIEDSSNYFTSNLLGNEKCDITFYNNIENTIKNNLTIELECLYPFSKAEHYPVQK